MDLSNTERVRVVASSENWIEGNAVSQLRGVANLPDVRAVVGMPDLHPGKHGPVGAAIVTQSTLYPHLIGNDIGCGMSLYRSDLQPRKVKLDAWSEKLPDLDRPWDGDATAWLESRGVHPSGADTALGTAETGELRLNPDSLFWKKKPPARRVIERGNHGQFRRIEGIWKNLVFKPIPRAWENTWDAYFKRHLKRIGLKRLRETYGRAGVYTVAVLPLTPRQLTGLPK